VPYYPKPKTHLHGYKDAKASLSKLDRQLELLTYALHLKGVNLKATCGKAQPNVDLTPFKFPTLHHVQIPEVPKFEVEEPAPTKQVPVTEFHVAAPEEHSTAIPFAVPKWVQAVAEATHAATTHAAAPAAPEGTHAAATAATTNAAATTAGKHETEHTRGRFTWIETPATIAPEPTPEYSLEWYKAQCRKNPGNLLLCSVTARKAAAAAAYANAQKKAEYEAASKDVSSLSDKLATVHKVREEMDVQVLAATDFGNHLSDQQMNDLNDRHAEVIELEDAIKAALNKAKRRQAAAEPEPPKPESK